MKIIFDKEEILKLLKSSVVKEIIPDGYMISEVTTRGYPVEEFHIELNKKEQ